jgi:hypothetical protein
MMTTTTGPRFAGLQKALAETRPRGATSSSRLAAHQSAKRRPAAPAAANNAAAPARRASTAPAKPETVIPPDVAAMGPDAVAAYKRGYARTEGRLAELAKNPAVAGRSSEALAMLGAGKTNAQIIAELTRGSRAKAADAVWDRARAAIYGSSTVTAGGHAPDRKAKSSATDDVWAKARASLGLTREN